MSKLVWAKSLSFDSWIMFPCRQANSNIVKNKGASFYLCQAGKKKPFDRSKGLFLTLLYSPIYILFIYNFIAYDDLPLGAVPPDDFVRKEASERGVPISKSTPFSGQNLSMQFLTIS